VAFVAATVKEDELPAAIEAGAAEIFTVGTAGVTVIFPPHPVNSKDDKTLRITQIGIENRDLPTRDSLMMISFLSRYASPLAEYWSDSLLPCSESAMPQFVG
jgi:hypothetical protein